MLVFVFCLQLLEDFNILYPHKSDFFFSKIAITKDHLINIAKKKVANSSKGSAINGIKSCLALIEEDHFDRSDEDLARSLAAILLLPYMIAIPNIDSGKRIKYSRNDVVNAFVSHVATEEDISVQEEQFKQKGNRVQPHIIYVGTSPLNPSKVFVVVDDVKYEQKDILTAVDTTFKIFMTLNAKYPSQCSDIWLLIQFGFFNIKTPYDGITMKDFNMTLKSICTAMKIYHEE